MRFTGMWIHGRWVPVQKAYCSTIEPINMMINHEEQYTVTQTTDLTWRVEDEEGNEYFVSFNEDGWKCSCKPFLRDTCEHIIAVKESLCNKKG